MKNIMNRFKKMLPKRQTVVKTIGMFLFIGLFLLYVVYSISHQPFLIPDSPLDEMAENVSRVYLASDNMPAYAEEVKDEQEPDKQSEEQERLDDQEENLNDKQDRLEEKHKQNNDDDQTSHEKPAKTGKSDEVNQDSSHIEIKDTDDLTGRKDIKENGFFTTSIIDKEIVTDEEYSFVIRQKEHEYMVKRTDVFLNEQLEEFDDTVTLNEGANTIAVTVSYEDKNGKPLSVSKTYTVYLKKNEIVIYSNLKDQVEVNKQVLIFTASAEFNGETIPVSVYLNDNKLKENSGHQLEANLAAGENKILITAEKDGIKAEKTYHIFYHKEETELQIETDLIDQEVPASSFSFSAIAKDGKKTVNLITLFNGKPLTDDGKGNYSVTLKEGENYFKLTAQSGEKTLTQDYVVTYVIPSEGGEEGDENENAPTITVHDIEDGETIRNSIRTFHVKASDYNGKSLTGGNGTVTATNNGNAIQVDWNDSEKISFTLNVKDGRNHIVITAKDQEGNTATQELTVIGQVGEDGDVIGTVTVSLEATTIGLGHLIPAEEVEIYQGERASAVLDRILKKHGFTYDYTGQHDSSFYLSAVYKNGLVTNPIIPSDLAELLERDMDRFDPEDYLTDSLGEFDFTNGSGWMYSVNGIYPNVGFADYYLKDGDNVRIRFTLAYGADIGGGMPGTNYHKEW